jgi:hypothetical protein
MDFTGKELHCNYLYTISSGITKKNSCLINITGVGGKYGSAPGRLPAVMMRFAGDMPHCLLLKKMERSKFAGSRIVLSHEK